MESLILKAINHVKPVSKKKVNVENIFHEIKISSATSLDKGTLQVEIDQMIIKGLIDENYKLLNKDILHLTEEPPVNEVHFAFDNETEKNQASNLPLIGTLKKISLVICLSLVLKKPKLATLKRI